MNALTQIGDRSRAFKRLLAPGPQLPIYLLMFVTNRCNASCDHCFYWRELNDKVKDELTLPEFERLASSLGPMLQVTLTGGSPELRKDLPEIAGIFSRITRPANITFCMLGHATDRILDHMEKILTSNPSQRFTVAISLDGLGEEHDRLRKLPGCFDRATKTLIELGKLKPKFPNLRLAIGMTVHGLNYETVQHTAQWARQELPIDLLKPILVRGDPMNRDTLDRVCVASYLNVIDQDRAWLNGSSQARFSPMDFVVNAKEAVQRRVISHISTNKEVPLTCSGARETAVVYPDGRVAGCELRAEVLGNLRQADFNFGKIWFGDEAKLFRKTTGKVAECQSCYHHCFLSPPIFRSPSLWPELLKSAASIYWNGRSAQAA